ncbi:MAG TPA: replicative DNA helicase [Bacteroidales bacterium]|jgi:replicative DNA helicase|nr:replicative DNA helicase [Bacteroidales bacterium]HOS57214.1 replicative DNA helicase [Bacteroidales bacterium]HRR04390.1 replicative DNA helicase [Bacteroidales bacterium]HXK73470.1 replicative DNA helicase [Bacteroidales bacterium]
MEKERVSEVKRENKISYNTIENTFGLTGKLTPQAVDFEEAILGALMIDKDAIAFIDFITDKMFYKEQHQLIFRVITDLFQNSHPIDLLTVTESLRKNKQLDFIGGPSYLASLTHRVASSANIEYHARVVMEKFVLRELIAISTATIKDAYDDSKDVLKLLDKAETDLFGIIQNNFKRESKQLDDIVKKALDELMELRNQDGNYQGVPSGIKAIDEKIGGWQKSDLIIVAARPGMGKTSFMLSVARNAAIDFKKPIALFSLEMSATQLVHRLFSMESGITSERISKGNLDENEWIRLMDKIQVLNAAPLFIDDTPALSVFDLRAKCRRLKHQHDIQMVLVDYLQLMHAGGDDNKGKGNREQEISFISRSLKALARELNVPVIALSQLSREVEKRPGSKRPQLSDLRESGSIEQDADMVIFIYRPEYYDIASFEKDDAPSEGLAEIMIEKNRHGSNARIRVRFVKQYTKFTDMDENYNFNSPLIPINEHFESATFESSMNEDVAYDSFDNNDNDYPF